MRTAPAAGSSGPTAKRSGGHRTAALGVAPSTTSGRVSLATAVLTMVTLGFMAAVHVAELSDDATLSQTAWLGVPAAIAAVLLLVTTASGMLALLARRERSVVVLLVTAAGLVVVYFVIGELIGLH